MKFQGAVVKEQGVTFAIIIVKRSVIDDRSQTAEIIRASRPLFPGVPVVLMAQDSWGTPTYYGRSDIAKFLANVPFASIPWREFTISIN